MTEKRDEQIWELCRKGDVNAFEHLYQRFYPLLFNYGIKLWSDEELVKDCIQDLFIKLIQNHSHLAFTPSIKGYFFKAFRHKLFDTLEHTSKTETIEPYVNSFTSEDLFQKLYENEQELTPVMKRLLTSYDQLTAAQKEIIYLYYIDEMTHLEIAEALDINYQSSKNLLYRAVTRLKKICFSGA